MAHKARERHDTMGYRTRGTDDEMRYAGAPGIGG